MFSGFSVEGCNNSWIISIIVRPINFNTISNWREVKALIRTKIKIRRTYPFLGGGGRIIGANWGIKYVVITWATIIFWFILSFRYSDINICLKRINSIPNHYSKFVTNNSTSGIFKSSRNYATTAAGNGDSARLMVVGQNRLWGRQASAFRWGIFDEDLDEVTNTNGEFAESFGAKDKVQVALSSKNLLRRNNVIPNRRDGGALSKGKVYPFAISWALIISLP